MQLPGEPTCGREAPHRQCSVSSSSLLMIIPVSAFAVCSSDIRVKCEHCSKAYSDPSSLRKHNVKVHHYPTRAGQRTSRNHAESVNNRQANQSLAPSAPESSALFFVFFLCANLCSRNHKNTPLLHIHTLSSFFLLYSPSNSTDTMGTHGQFQCPMVS